MSVPSETLKFHSNKRNLRGPHLGVIPIFFQLRDLSLCRRRPFIVGIVTLGPFYYFPFYLDAAIVRSVAAPLLLEVAQRRLLDHLFEPRCTS